jgi:two-component system response regulator (stage 0 sporulation protein F)
MEHDEIINAQRAAEFLDAHVETIRRMARKGIIPAFKIGKDWRFHKASLITWSKSNPELKKGITILVIEDDGGVRRLMRRLLESQGYRVLTASNGVEGMTYVQNDSVNMVLLDLEMPVMNGPEFIGELRKGGLNIPVIIVSGYPDSALMVEASRFSPLMLVPKPIDSEALLLAVKRTLRGSMEG